MPDSGRAVGGVVVGVATVAIEALPLGARIAARNPLGLDRELGEPDSTWLRIAFHTHRSDGAVIESELLRPRDWIERRELFLGARIPLALEELGGRSYAVVTAIGTCPPLAEGPGQLVTGRFRSPAGLALCAVHIDQEPEPIVGTVVHPAWSETREAFVPMGELRPGEVLRTANGSAVVESVEARLGDQPVYNVEVDASHVYHVGAALVLSHNMSATQACGEISRLRTRLATENLDNTAKAAIQKQIDDIYGSVKGLGGWNKYATDILKLEGKRPGDHAHHILFKEGMSDAQKALSLEGRKILEKHGIDPYFGKENFVWAKAVDGLHGVDNLSYVLGLLRRADASGGGRNAIEAALKEAGDTARTFGY